jgi:Peptidase propeptide and YPEB domain
MHRHLTMGLATFLILHGGAVFAQEQSSPAPPQNAKKLSEIVTKVENRNDFQYIDEIEWDGKGAYVVTYFTSDKAKVEMTFNAVTGEPQ